jgi:hypothetical protein
MPEPTPAPTLTLLPSPDAETDARDNPTAAIAANGSANALAQRRR